MITKLQSILSIEEWEKIQDELAKLTGTAIITVDYKGIPITKHSECTEFCKVIRNNEITCKRCYKCDAFAGLEAVRINKPYIYLCHCGVVDVAVPIVIDDRYLGAVMFGQVRLKNSDNNKLERMLNEFNAFGKNIQNQKQTLYEEYLKLPEIEYETVVQIAKTIETLVNYIIVQRIKLQNAEELYEYAIQNRIKNTGSINFAESDMASPLSLHDFIGQEDYTIPQFVQKTSVIYPALLYIHNNEGYFPTMNEMARLCHVSTAYFSRKFLKETGDNYSAYVMKFKIALIKKYVKENDKTIAQISNILGFQDASYLSRVFKKYTGISPAEYKKQTVK